VDLHDLLPTENRHPWEIARAASIIGLIEDVCPSLILDIGAGDLYFATKLREKFHADVYAVDTMYEKNEDRCGLFLRTDLNNIPKGAFDLVFLLDVIEHNNDERLLLDQALEALKPGGTMVVTVPAFNWLLSTHDLRLKHIRRYRMIQFKDLMKGLEIDGSRFFYFFFTLFFIRAIQVVLERFGGMSVDSLLCRWEFHENHPMTRGFVKLLAADFAFCKRLANLGFQLPGLSICMMSKKKFA
jgi:SAM-dependent methyltransferase